jgi:hypothetical protein
MIVVIGSSAVFTPSFYYIDNFRPSANNIVQAAAQLAVPVA